MNYLKLIQTNILKCMHTNIDNANHIVPAFAGYGQQAFASLLSLLATPGAALRSGSQSMPRSLGQ